MSTTDVHTEWLDDHAAYLARARRPRGGVLVIHEGFGLNEHAQAVCRRLAAEGFTALAPDLYRRGPDRLARYDEYDKPSPCCARCPTSRCSPTSPPASTALPR